MKPGPLETALLLQDIQKLYKEYRVEYRLQTLSPNVLNKENKKKGAVATLKGPAAVIRHLIPLSQILTGKILHVGLNASSVCTSLQNFFSKGIQLRGKQ